MHLWSRAVVEDGDGAILLPSGIVLPVGAGALPHLEVTLLATETPQHLPVSAVYLVDGGGVAGGDEEVVVVVHLYGVDVEVVELVAVVFLVVGLLDADVVQAVPLEEDLSGLDVHLLGDALDHPPLRGATEVGEIKRYQVVDRE